MQAANTTAAPDFKYKYEWNWNREYHELDFTFHECHQFNSYVTFPWGFGYPTRNASDWYLTAPMPNAAIGAVVTEKRGFSGGEVVIEPCQTSAPYPPVLTTKAPVVSPGLGESFLVESQCMEIVVRLDPPNATDCRDAQFKVVASLLSDFCDGVPTADFCQPGYRAPNVTSSPSARINFTGEVDPMGTKATGSPSAGTNVPGSQAGSPAPAKTSAAHAHRRASWWIGIAMALGAVVAAA